MVAIVFFDVEIHAAIALVGIAVVDNFLHQLLLFNDVSGGVGRYIERNGIYAESI